MTAGTPSTAAGRALVREIPEDADGYIDPEGVTKAILDIERQAAALALADIAEKVRGLPGFRDPRYSERFKSVGIVHRAAVLALLASL